MTYNNNLLCYENLHRVEKFINETPHTLTEQSPMYVMTGKLPTRPWIVDEQELNYNEILNKIREKLQKYQENYERKMNGRIKKKMKFEVGDQVIVKSLQVGNRSKNQCAKLQLPYEGPYFINSKVSENTYELVNRINKVTINQQLNYFEF